jgi:hypothetical protein
MAGKTASLLAAIALLGMPAAGHAAAGGDVSLTTPFAWSGGPGQGLYVGVLLDIAGGSSEDVQCTKVYECDSTLLRVTERGDLAIHMDGDPGLTPQTGQADADIDLYLFESDAQGVIGEEVTRSATISIDEELYAPDLAPGYYVARVQYYIGVNLSYTAEATLSEHPEE